MRYQFTVDKTFSFENELPLFQLRTSVTEPQMFCGKCGINKVFEVRESLYIQVHSVQMVFRYKSNFLFLSSDNWPLVQQLNLLMSCQADTSQDDMHVSFPECYTVQAQSIKQKDPNPLSLFLCDSVTLQRTQKSRNSEVRYFFTGRDLFRQVIQVGRIDFFLNCY